MGVPRLGGFDVSNLILEHPFKYIQRWGFLTQPSEVVGPDTVKETQKVRTRCTVIWRQIRASPFSPLWHFARTRFTALTSYGRNR